FTTSFRTSGSSRSKNVTNGCHLIDGTTLYPGDTFSTYEEVSPFSEENGYYLAGSYLQGKVVDSLGGGICQVSTTLYNAVIRAELEVIERYNHSMIVSYVDPSSDAAISGTSKDFKFKNTTQYPIYIEGYANSDKNLTFTVYGVETRPATRKVDFESEVIEKIEPKGENIVADAGAPVGTISVQSAHIGYVAKLWKIVSEDGQEVSRTEFNKSTYQLSPRTATVGIASADPSVTAAMQAAIATGSIDQVKALVGAYKASQTAPPASAPTQADIDSAAESAPLQNPAVPTVPAVQ
ncbi:MAG: VanW family protein, partial [Clostridium sp.]